MELQTMEIIRPAWFLLSVWHIMLSYKGYEDTSWWHSRVLPGRAKGEKALKSGMSRSLK